MTSLSYNVKFNLCSFNCEGIKSSIESIKCLCVNNDFILLQEHWLYKDELSLLRNLHEDFDGFGISAMTSDDKLISGRPYGGTGILWRKSLDKACDIVTYEDDPRIIGVEIKQMGVH